MKQTAPLFFKKLLTQIGARLSAHSLHQLQMTLNYMKLGRWMVKNNFKVGQRLPTREAVFSIVAEQIRDRQVAYLEFGVYRGKSMRYWSAALKNPTSILHGFDSFEGLPEDFDVDGPYEKGHFDVEGNLPQIADPRVKFFKGWFEETLPAYQLPQHEVLVIMVDADLYSSTKCVLDHLRPYIKSGVFLYFDDMCRPDHEPKAFEEFLQESGLKFRVVSALASLNNIFFECV